MLIEYGFITNANDRKALQDGAKQDLLAQATVDGIKDFSRQGDKKMRKNRAGGKCYRPCLA